jgi:hypothetical protein
MAQPTTTENKKGKIVKFFPMTDQNTGQQKFFEGSHGRLYDWGVELDNGDKGKSNGKEEGKFRFKEGDEVIYVKDTYVSQGKADFVLFKKMNFPKDSPQAGGKSTYNDPLNNKRMAMGIAQQVSIQMFDIIDHNATQEEIVLLSVKFHAWIMTGENNRDILSARWYALTVAVDTLKLSKFPESFVNERHSALGSWILVVIELADKYYEQRATVS